MDKEINSNHDNDTDYEDCYIEDCDFNCVGCQFLNDCPNSRVAW